MTRATPDQGRPGSGRQARQPSQASQGRQADQASGGRGVRQVRRPAGAGGRRPLPPGRTLYTPGASPARRSLEQSSAQPLIFLHQLPRWLPPLVLAGLLLAGLTVRGWGGAAALVVVAAFLGWLAALSWPRLSAQSRLLRVAALCGVLALAAFQAVR